MRSARNRAMVWLNYHHLYYFRMIAQEGSIARASQKLRLGQPTLSTQLKQLEDALGHQLFDRKNRKLTLTEAGQTALEYANEVFKLGEEMIGVLRSQFDIRKKHFQIGALGGVPQGLLARLIFQLTEREEVSISIHEGKLEDLYRDLVSRRIDFLISNTLPSQVELSDVLVQTLGKLEVIVCGIPKFKHLTRNFPQSLLGQSFILPAHPGSLRRKIDEYLKQNRVQISRAVETQSPSLQKVLALEGLGLTVLSKIEVEQEIASGQLMILGHLGELTEEIYLISDVKRISSEIVSQLTASFKCQMN